MRVLPLDRDEAIGDIGEELGVLLNSDALGVVAEVVEAELKGDDVIREVRRPPRFTPKEFTKRGLKITYLVRFFSGKRNGACRRSFGAPLAEQRGGRAAG